MSVLPDGLTAGPASESDASAIAALLASRSLAVIGVIDTDEVEIRSVLTAPDAGGRFAVVRDAAGELVAFVGLWSPESSAHVLAIVELREELVGTPVHEALLSYTALKAEPIAAGRQTLVASMARDATSRALLERRGLVAVRRFLLMDCAFSGTLEPPSWPASVTSRPYVPARDLEAVHACLAEAFRDHFGGGFAALESFRHELAGPEYAPELVTVAWRDGRVVGAAVATSTFPETPGYGYVGELGVVESARGCGLGLALLLESFARLEAAGCSGCALHVDADSETGATRLYERAGMAGEERYVSYGMSA